ncbi:putative UPF0676 protein [Halenospora varia]|nr:putative UPF0676 protein [Halenospora varia]
MATTTITEKLATATLADGSASDLSKFDYKNLEAYVHPPETKEKLNWAELVTLDLEDYNREGGKERLAKQLEHAVHHVGFFYVKNYGLSQEEVDHQFTLAKHFFALPVDEKAKYECNYAAADYNGWRRSGRRLENKGFDNVEIYNQRGPPLLKLFAIILQLPDEDYLVKQHTYEKKSEDHFRYMLYRKRTPEEWAASGGGLGNGHTDLGTVTLLFRQPIAGLQILGDDGNWTWVSAQPGTITVNLADTISHLTGGWLKSSVHRVVTPPKDQWAYDRTGLLYFARPHNETVLNPLDSPVLNAAGVKSRFEKPVTVEQWVKAKQTLQLNPDIAAKKWAEAGDGTVEVLAGFRDRKYKE